MLLISHLKNTLVADFLKIRKTMTPWLVLLYPVLTVLLVILFNSEAGTTGKSTLKFTGDILKTGAFFFPFYLVVLISLLLYFDHQASAWKYLYSLAVPRYAYYVSRLIQIFIILVVTFILFHVFILAGIQLYKLIKPDCELSSIAEIMKISSVFFIAVSISAFPMIIIQYWISLISKNIIVPFIVGILAITLPVAVVIILGITGVITKAYILQKLMQANPFTLCYIPVFESITKGIGSVQIISRNILYWNISSILLAVGFYFHVSRRNVV